MILAREMPVPGATRTVAICIDRPLFRQRVRHIAVSMNGERKFVGLSAGDSPKSYASPPAARIRHSGNVLRLAVHRRISHGSPAAIAAVPKYVGSATSDPRN